MRHPIASRLLLTTALIATSTPSRTALTQTPAPPWTPDSLLALHRYPELSAWLGHHPDVPQGEISFFQGVLDNRRNQVTASIGRLTTLVRRPTTRIDSTRYRLVLETLADDYTKAYRYGDAARALQQLDHDLGSTLPPDERASIQAMARLRSLIKDAPPQRATVGSDVVLPARRDTIGLIEAPVRVGTDSSWWIFDTGANFSTITESVARRLGLKLSADTATTTGITGTSVGVHVAVIPRLTIGTATVDNVVVLVLPDSALSIPAIPFQLDALLGFPVFEALGNITFAKDHIAIHAGPRGAPTEGSTLYLEGLNAMVLADVGGSSHLYQFDSGADRSVLTTQFVDAYPAMFQGLAPSPISFGGAGGSTTVPSYHLPSLDVGFGGITTTLHDVLVLAKPVQTSFADSFGNLGQDVLAGVKSYTLDFGRMLFLLEG